MTSEEIKHFMDAKVIQYNQPQFIEDDPIQIPRSFNAKEDQEISGFLTATIAWGQRKTIIKNARQMMSLLGESPHDFILHHKEADLDTLKYFVHRTFNGIDLSYFIKGLKHIYAQHGGLENVFTRHSTTQSTQAAIAAFKSYFFEPEHPKRTTKHISDPSRGSAAKRLNMFLRWMVRDSKTGVDLGIWKQIPSSSLSCPLDVHSGNVARKLGLLKRQQNDAKAVKELDDVLRSFDPLDPVKYDFALFGLGVFEGW
jgi:uncharacterized protein (TIGR02757 family)